MVLVEYLVVEKVEVMMVMVIRAEEEMEREVMVEDRQAVVVTMEDSKGSMDCMVDYLVETEASVEEDSEVLAEVQGVLKAGTVVSMVEDHILPVRNSHN